VAEESLKDPAIGEPHREPDKVNEASESSVDRMVAIPLGKNFADSFADAVMMLRYAAETGIAVPPDIVEPILLARIACDKGVWTDTAIGTFLSAFTRLAAMLKPVSIASLKTPENVVAKSITCYRLWGAILTAVVIFLSLLNFVNSGIADRISKDIDENNQLAVALRAELGPWDTRYPDPDELCTLTAGKVILPLDMAAVKELDTITKLQRFALLVRDIDSRSVKLNRFVFRMEKRQNWRRDQLQLDPQLPDFRKAAYCKIGVYEEVRNFAQNILANDSVLYGALSAYLLPVLYAVLGAFAYQIRLFTEQVRLRSFQENRANSARVIAAVVAGSIVSLFNGFTQGATLSPLAVAFLVGYGVEIFYAFLDRVVTAFASSGSAESKPRPPGANASV
jgi:hypothetical protein